MSLLRKLSISSSSKFLPRSVSVRRNALGSFGFTLAGGLEENRLPFVVLRADEEVICKKGKLNDGAEVLEINGKFVAGDRLKNVQHVMDMGKSDTIILTLVDASSSLVHLRISQLLAAQKPTGKTSEFIEQIRCNVYDNTTPVTTRPPRKGDTADKYTFISREDFLRYVADERMLEWGEHAASGHLYGTLIPQPGDDLLPAARAEIETDAGGAAGISPPRILHLATAGPSREPSSSAVAAAVDSEADSGAAELAAHLLVFNVVVVARASFYEGWGLVLEGGPGTGVLPHVAHVAAGVRQLAWLRGPLTPNASVLAVNGVNVATASPAHILSLMNRLCAAELTLVSLSAPSAAPGSSAGGTTSSTTTPSSTQPLTHAPPLSYSALLRASPLHPALLAAQADVRLALQEDAVQHTTREQAPGKAAEGSSHVFVDEAEFAALATKGQLLSWWSFEDGVRYGVAQPLRTWRHGERASSLAALLRRQHHAAVVATLPALGAARHLPFRLAALPGAAPAALVLEDVRATPGSSGVATATTIAATGEAGAAEKPTAGGASAPASPALEDDSGLAHVQHGMVLEAIDGDRAAGGARAVGALLQRPQQMQLTLRHDWERIVAAYGRPPPAAATPSVLVDRTLLVLLVLALLVLLIGIVWEDPLWAVFALV